MSRRSRLQLAGAPFHVIQRGNNRIACFYTDQDFQFYLEHLALLAKRHQVNVHAYVLMPNHVHLLATPEQKDGLSQLMKFLGQRYVQHINRGYRRSGTLWEGRFRSCLVEPETYLMACQRYIELNPVRAGLVQHPAEYEWSSYRANAQREKSAVVKPHSLYVALGDDIERRGIAYRDLFRYEQEPKVIDELRHATNGGFCVGSERFQKQITEMLNRRVVRAKAGRPKSTRT